MTKTFEIPSTPCTLAHVNQRTEKHGDSDVPAVDLKFVGIVFTKEMLNEFTGDKHAWDLMFEQKKGNAVEPTQPYFENERYYVGKFVDCHANVRFGMQESEYELEDVKVTNISFKRLVGGNCAATLTVQHEVEDTEIGSQLLEYNSREVHLHLLFGKQASAESKKQQNLNLGESKSPAGADKGNGSEDRPATH